MTAPFRSGVLLLALLSSLAGAYEEGLYLFRRAVYLETAAMTGAWWANPALAADVTERTVLTVNASPIGDRYTISSARFLWPIMPALGAGVGIVGGGEDQTGRFLASNEGATYNSRFVFSRPSFQAGVAGRLEIAGAAGVLASIGMERLSIGLDRYDNFMTLGFGVGWISPAVLNILEFGASTFWTRHLLDENAYWERDAKLGLRLITPQEWVRATVEYAFPLTEGFQFRTPRRPWTYEILKVLVSVRAYGILGALIGLSTDFSTSSELWEYNGEMLHLGLETRTTTVYPFFGGYELGISLDGRWNIVHRFWFGYLFGTRSRQKVTGLDRR
jgi:hypothetical protein